MIVNIKVLKLNFFLFFYRNILLRYNHPYCKLSDNGFITGQTISSLNWIPWMDNKKKRNTKKPLGLRNLDNNVLNIYEWGQKGHGKTGLTRSNKKKTNPNWKGSERWPQEKNYYSELNIMYLLLLSVSSFFSFFLFSRNYFDFDFPGFSRLRNWLKFFFRFYDAVIKWCDVTPVFLLLLSPFFSFSILDKKELGYVNEGMNPEKVFAGLVQQWETSLTGISENRNKR